MLSIKHLFTLIVSIILMSLYTCQGSVPVTWQRSAFFNSGQIICTPTSSGSSFTTTATYSPALSGTPNSTKRPSLGITDMNHQFTLPTVYWKIELDTFTRTSLTVHTIVNYVSTFSMKVYYLAPDPSMTYQYSSFNWNSTNSNIGPFTGPFHSYTRLPMSGLTNPSGMNMSHEVTMLPFINGVNITSNTYCYEIILRSRVYDATHYQINITSGCPGMVMSLVCWSRIIFDITLIQDIGYCYFQYGTYTALNNNDTSLYVLLNPFIAGNFLLGISQFKYTSPTAPIIMSFSTTLADLVQTKSHTVFERLAMTYWSLKYRYCPPGYPTFHLDTQTCHDLCPEKTYYSATVHMCKDCFYTCKTCTGYPACTSCQPTQNRILNGTSCLPQAGYYDNGTAYAPACSSQCIDCTNSSVCLTCNTGYILNTTTFQCQSICMQGCTICPNLTTCTYCDVTSGYYLVNSTCIYCNYSLNNFINMTTLQCQSCTIVGCTACFSLTVCNACDLPNSYAIEGLTCEYCNNTLNQFINSSSLCQRCTQPGCITCLSLTTCSYCNNTQNYYLDLSVCRYCNSTLNQFINATSQCQLCNLNQCIQCASLTACSVCNLTASYYLVNQSCDYCNNSLNNFINLTNSLCEACSLQGCITCASLSTCTLCNATSNYYAFGSICSYCNNTLNDFINSSTQCQHCTIPGCITCSSLTACSACNLSDFYYLASSNCQYCNITLNYYITTNQTCQYCNNSLNTFINTSFQCQQCSIQGCITCSSLSTCTLCNANSNYYILGSICGYCNNSLNNFVNSTFLCQHCTIPGCITCSSLSTCSACNLSEFFYLASSNCQYCNLTLNYYITAHQTCEYCNNSLNFFINATSQCEACSIQGCITCSALTTCTQCNSSNNYYLNGSTCAYCNNTLNYFINSSTLLCEICTLPNCILCNNLQTCQICNNSAGYFLTTSLLCQQCKLQGCLQCSTLTTCKLCNETDQYSLSSSGICSHCNKCKCYFQQQLPASIPSIEYSQKQCSNFKKTDSVLYSIAIVSISVMVLATFSTCLIGIQLIGVLQLAYLNMADNYFVHLYLSPILGWYYANGYNIRPVQFHAVPSNIQQIGYTSAFLSNINVMFGLLIFSTILLGFVQVLARFFYFKINNIRKITRQIYMAMYLFNCFNIAFCVGLQYRYYRPQDIQNSYYSLSVVCASLVIPLYIFVILWLSFVRKIGCGQYTQRFKQDCTNQLYVPFTIVYRFALGLYMSIDSQQDNSTLLILAISLSFVLFNLINLSYKKFYHNYRANISHITHLIILMVTNYYRSMKKNYPVEVKASITTPAIIQIVFLGICVFFALANAIYEIIVKIKTIITSKRECKIRTEQTVQNISGLDQMTHSNQATHSKNKFVETQILED